MTAIAARPTFRLPLALAALVTLVACADLNDTQRRTLTGAGIGTATGAVVGSFIFDAIEQRQGK
jgi:uncharacterized membrane protein YfcA